MSEGLPPISLVVFHAACADGFTAAWVVDKALREIYRERAPELRPMSYGEPPPEDVEGRDVVMVDISWSRPEMEEMAEKAIRLRAFDHHATGEAELAGLSYCEFDMKRSAAAMAWDAFFPGQHRPWVVDYVQDRDLWRWRLPSSKAVNAYIQTRPFTLAAWDALAEKSLVEVRDLGVAILDYLDEYIRETRYLEEHQITFDGRTVPCVNAPKKGISELLEAMALDAPSRVALGWFKTRAGDYEYSLRSRGEVDVSKVAERYGGGGHPRAAGFRLPYLLPAIADSCFRGGG